MHYVERFNRWAATYDRHILHRLVLPQHRLDLSQLDAIPPQLHLLIR